MDENCIIYDWLTFTVKEMTEKDILSNFFLDDVSWVLRSGKNGYKSAYFFGGMWVMFDGRNDMGVCVELSGQGCRQYETCGLSSLSELVSFVSSNPKFNVTRIDVAYDDIDKNGPGLLNVGLIDRLALRDRYISKFSNRSGSWSGKHSDQGNKDKLAYSVYFGSPQSKIRFRIYDKALERGGLDYHWTRFEIQLRDEAATNYVLSSGSPGFKFSGLINNYLRFIVPTKTDTNRRRWPSPKWWTDFLFCTEKITVYSRKDVEYNLSRLENYVCHQAGASALTLIKILGEEYFLKKIKERENYLNINQQQLIESLSSEFSKKKANRDSYSPWGVAPIGTHIKEKGAYL